jgi:hypothetical protein
MALRGGVLRPIDRAIRRARDESGAITILVAI